MDWPEVDGRDVGKIPPPSKLNGTVMVISHSSPTAGCCAVIVATNADGISGLVVILTTPSTLSSMQMAADAGQVVGPAWAGTEAASSNPANRAAQTGSDNARMFYSPTLVGAY